MKAMTEIKTLKRRLDTALRGKTEWRQHSMANRGETLKMAAALERVMEKLVSGRMVLDVDICHKCMMSSRVPFPTDIPGGRVFCPCAKANIRGERALPPQDCLHFSEQMKR